jgi:hypothetical protein
MNRSSLVKNGIESLKAALSDCDALVAFLHPGFQISEWWDQKIGWVLGRKRPLLPLSYGLNPMDFIGKYQAQPCVNAYPATSGGIHHGLAFEDAVVT